MVPYGDLIASQTYLNDESMMQGIGDGSVKGVGSNTMTRSNLHYLR